MAHGFLGFKDWAFFPWLSRFFADQGFPTIRFNFSGSGMGGQTDGPFTELEAFQNDTITHQTEDLRSLIFLAARGTLDPGLPAQEKVFLWGHSRGGGVCLLAAKTPEVGAVAAWASIARVDRYFHEVKSVWRAHGYSLHESGRTGQELKSSIQYLEDVERWGKAGDIPAYLHRLDIPVLLVHGLEDTSVSPEESESLAALRPQTRLVLLAGGDHKFNSTHPFKEPSPVLQEAARKTVEFYKSIL